MIMRIGKPITGLAIVAVLGFGAAASAMVIQPDEANSKDVFTYQLAVPNAGFGISGTASTTNLDTDSLAVTNPTSPVGIFLGTAETNVTSHALPGGGSVDTGHDTHTWIQFNLPGGVAASNVVSATLNLYALDGKAITGAFDNPAPGLEVTTRVFEANTGWDEQIVTWNNAAPRQGPQIDEVVQDKVDAWVTFDVTGTVKDWLAGVKVNNGFFLDQKDVVPSSDPSLGGIEGVVASLYASSAYADDPSLRPFLEITLIPEPSTVALMGIGVGLLAMRRRRQAAIA